MSTLSTSSPWAHIRVDTGDVATVSTRFTKSPDDNGVDLIDILNAVKEGLPLVSSEKLRPSTTLGEGSSFHVCREVFRPLYPDTAYYVAVKHMKLLGRSHEHQRQLYDSVMMEVKVLMSLLNHECIIPILGYGWTHDALEGARPYLVMDYSDYGTLTDHLVRCGSRIRPYERRELALDVAVGLRALHYIGIVHGDIKMANVLVFGCGASIRPQVAKISDFGCAIFEDEFQKGGDIPYRGTTIYNAPEIAGRQKVGAHGSAPRTSSFAFYRKADVYSFGILLWETMKSGKRFINTKDPTTETLESFLERKFAEEDNFVLRRARGMTILASDPKTATAVTQTFPLCLEDEPLARAEMTEVVACLVQGLDEARPPVDYPLARTTPQTDSEEFKLSIAGSDGVDESGFNHLAWMSRAWAARCAASGNPIATTEVKGLSTIVKRGQTASTGAGTIPYNKPNELDIFLASVLAFIPWGVQCQVVAGLKNSIIHERDPGEKALAHLKLAICFQTGFGITLNSLLAFDHLSKAKSNNYVASVLHGRIASATCTTQDKSSISSNEGSNRYSRYDVPGSSAKPFSEWLRIEHRSPTLNSDSGSSLSMNPSLALITACIKGQFDVAKDLLERSPKMELSWREPSPFHWLIMFDDAQASKLCNMLSRVCFEIEPTDDQKTAPINFKSSRVVSFQEHSLELAGTALHWATRVGKLALVRSLIKRGADINIRTAEEYVLSNGLSTERSLVYSPLDLAVAYHLPDITECLLDAGAEAEGGGLREQHFSFNLIAMPVQPFSRFAIHGPQVRNALTRTIRILSEKGQDIEAKDFEGKTAFELACKHPNQDVYILEELLQAGASVSFLTSNTTAAHLISRTSEIRFFNESKLKVVLDRVENINALDSFGFNPLHYVAQGGSDTMTSVLLQHPAIDPDSITKDGRTALTLAAECDAIDVITSLLESNASAEGKGGPTPLEVSVIARKPRASARLLLAGAKTIFEDVTRTPRSTVLIGAIARGPGAEPLVGKLLDEHPRVQYCINFQDEKGWSALHHAAWYGDFRSVEALIKHGADFGLLGSDELAEQVTALQLSQRLYTQVCNNREAALHPKHELFGRGGATGIGYFIHGLQDVVKILQSLSSYK